MFGVDDEIFQKFNNGDYDRYKYNKETCGGEFSSVNPTFYQTLDFDEDCNSMHTGTRWDILPNWKNGKNDQKMHIFGLFLEYTGTPNGKLTLTSILNHFKNILEA